MPTYSNDLRLKEITTGDESGTWGTSTNTNLALIADAFSLGTKQMAANADETFTMPDATADGTRSLYLKITSAVSLTATRTVTLAPNTVSKVWIIENATTGGQSIIIAQGSGATVTVATGTKVMVVTDGAGAGAAVTNANPTEVGGTVTSVSGTGTVNGITLTGTVTSSGSLTLGGTLSGVSLTTQVTGTLPVANGGTGLTSYTANGVVYASGTGTLTSGSALTYNGTNQVKFTGTGSYPSFAIDNSTAIGSGNLQIWQNGVGKGSLTLSGSISGDTSSHLALFSDVVGGEIRLYNNGSGTLKWSLGTTGVATMIANPVISSGTANGITYLNGSKALTSGAGIQSSDGTNLIIGAASARASSLLDVRGNVTVGSNATYYGTLSYNAGTGAFDARSEDGVFTWTKAAGPTTLATLNATGLTVTGTISGTLTGATGLPIDAGTTGTLPVSRGGTGATTLTANNVILGNGTSAPLFVAPGTTGNVLTSNGSTWTSAAAAAGSQIVRVARTSDTAITSANASNLIDITSGTFSQTFNSCASLGSGFFCYIRNSGTGNITLDPNASETIDGLTSYIMYPGEVRLVQCDGSALRTVVLTGFYAAFTASGTFTKPPGYSAFQALVWGAGGGGAKDDAGGGDYAGAGGGGACVYALLPTSSYGTTETITIGAGGAGATTNLGNGTAGGNTTVGSLITSYGGGGGGGGDGGGIDGRGGGGGGWRTAGTTGGAGSAGLGGQPFISIGASVYNGGVSFGGGDGFSSSSYAFDAVWGGGGGRSGSGALTGGKSIYGGGGGGGSVTTLTGGTSQFGGAGGAGGTTGSGTAGTAPAGGGGATQTGATAGAGARGEVRIWGVV